MTNEVTRIIPNRSIETAKLIERLKGGKPGDTITDEELTKIANGLSTAVNGPGYGRLQSAMRFVMREYHIVWKRINKAGAIKCLDSLEASDDMAADLGVIRRRSNRARHKMAAIKLDGLTADQQRRTKALSAQIMTIGLFATSSTTKKLEARNVVSPFDPSKVIELFKDTNGKASS